MIKTFTKQSLSTRLFFLLVANAPASHARGQQSVPTRYSGRGAPLSAEELQQLVDFARAHIQGSQEEEA